MPPSASAAIATNRSPPAAVDTSHTSGTHPFPTASAALRMPRVVAAADRDADARLGKGFGGRQAEPAGCSGNCRPTPIDPEIHPADRSRGHCRVQPRNHAEHGEP